MTQRQVASSQTCPTGGVELSAANGTSEVCHGPRGPAGVPCSNCVRRGSLNGSEVPVYRAPTACGSSALSLSPGFCNTIQCGRCVTGAPSFYACNGTCQQCGSSQRCALQLAGYLLSPSIGN